jgi:hypothetical protein
MSSAGGWPGPGALGCAAGALEPGVIALSAFENHESPAIDGPTPPFFNSP